MSVGTGTALAIGLGASAATQLAGAKMKSSAANKAAKTQGVATQEAQRLQYQLAQQAMAAQAQQFARTNQLYQPYTNAAPQSLAALYSHLGIPQGPPPGAGGPPPGGPGMGGAMFGGMGGTLVGPDGRPVQGGPPGMPPPGAPGMAMQRPRPWEVPGPGLPPGVIAPGGPQLPPPEAMAALQGARPRQAPPVPLGEFYRRRARVPRTAQG